MTEHERQIVRARITRWPGERYDCVWPKDPDEEERFWLLAPDGRIVATFWRYRFGMLRERR